MSRSGYSDYVNKAIVGASAGAVAGSLAGGIGAAVGAAIGAAVNVALGYVVRSHKSDQAAATPPTQPKGEAHE